MGVLNILFPEGALNIWFLEGALNILFPEGFLNIFFPDGVLNHLKNHTYPFLFIPKKYNPKNQIIFVSFQKRDWTNLKAGATIPTNFTNY